jgi:hypothetical protein
MIRTSRHQRRLVVEINDVFISQTYAWAFCDGRLFRDMSDEVEGSLLPNGDNEDRGGAAAEIYR